MDKNNQTNTDISGGEKDALHDAGVDVATSGASSDGFVDIDAATSDESGAGDVGITFVAPTENKEDLSSLAEKKRKQEAPKQESVPADKKASPKIQEDSSTTNDLEQEFHKTVGDATPSTPTESFSDRIFNLESLLTKIKEKLGFKKSEVRQELESLKKMKEDIAKDIENIKELEDSEHKIEDQLDKIEVLKKEISGIEHEVEDELK